MRILPRVIGRVAAAAILASIVTGCATSQWAGGSRNVRTGTRYSLLPSGPEYGPNSSSVPDDILFNSKSPASLYSRSELQFEHPSVDAFVLVYETRSHGFFERALDRSRHYIGRMVAILTEEGVPPELAYLPLIESGFNNVAVSPAGAAGPWQFIPATGRRYGLRIDRYVDERRDPDKSTRAAAQYLRDLYNMFGNWHLSLAAYNTGEYRVARTMDREGTDSYWDLMENRDLHPETCDYVPRFLAALAIAQSPEAHGFEAAEPEPYQDELVEVDRSVSLRALAELVGSSETEMKELNPALVRGVTPPDSSGYQIHVPLGTKDQFEVAYARMRHEARDAQAQPELAAAYMDGDSYRVRKGDTVASIARRAGVSPQMLLRRNGLKSAKQLRVGKVLRLPGGEAPASALARSGPNAQVARVAAAPSASSAYRVKKGDTLAAVARTLGVSEQALLKANGLKSAKGLKAGNTIRLPQAPKAEPVKVAKAARRK